MKQLVFGSICNTKRCVDIIEQAIRRT